MITWLLALIPAPWLAVLKGLPWRLIGYALLAAAAVWGVLTVNGWRLDSHALKVTQAALLVERSCTEGSACATAIDRLQKAGIAAVGKARQAAREAAEREQAARDARVAEEAERLTAAASEARVKADAWRRKYQATITADPDGACARWAKEPVPCPVE